MFVNQLGLNGGELGEKTYGLSSSLNFQSLPQPDTLDKVLV